MKKAAKKNQNQNQKPAIIEYSAYFTSLAPYFPSFSDRYLHLQTQ